MINTINKHYKKLITLAILLGVLTNTYLTGLFLYLEADKVALSPVISAILFFLFYLGLKKDFLSTKQTFYLLSFTIVLEVFIHTYALGWNMGFYYYLFLLPLTIFLDTTWKTSTILFFNGCIALLSGILVYFTYGKIAVYAVPLDIQMYVGVINMASTFTIAMLIMAYFRRAIIQRDNDLMEASIGLGVSNEKVVGQPQQLEVLLKQIHHRVKDNFQIISSIMSLEQSMIENKELIDVFDESQRRVKAIALIHQNLYQDTSFNKVSFHVYLKEILKHQQTFFTNLKTLLETPKIILYLDTAVPLGLVISEMIANAIKRVLKTAEKPIIRVELVKTGKDFELFVTDNGAGLPDDFDLDYPDSLGLEIVTALTEQIGGKVDCYNNNEGGATFKVSLKEKCLTADELEPKKKK